MGEWAIREREYREALTKADQVLATTLGEAQTIFDAAEAEIADKRGKPPDEDNDEYWEMIWPAFRELWEARRAATLGFRVTMRAVREKYNMKVYDGPEEVVII